MNEGNPEMDNLTESRTQLAKLKNTGNYELAIILAKKICDQLHKKNQKLEYANELTTLATLHRDMGDYGKAKCLYHEALTIMQNFGIKNSISFAKILTQMGILYRQEGEYIKSKNSFTNAVLIYKNQSNKYYEDYSVCLANFAELFRMMGLFAEAETKCKEAMKLFAEEEQKYNVNYALALIFYVEVYKDRGEYANALPICKHAIEIYEKNQVNNLEYAISILNMAELLFFIKDYDNAKVHYQKVLAILEKTVGKNNPYYFICLNDISVLYQYSGNPLEALPIMEKTLNRFIDNFGKKSKESAIFLTNTAVLYAKKGDKEPAALLYNDALKIYEDLNLTNSPDYTFCQQNFAALNHNFENEMDTISFFEQTIKKLKKSVNTQHWCLIRTLDDLSEIYLKQKNYEKVIPILEEILNIRKINSTKTDTRYIKNLNDIIKAYFEVQNDVKALSYCEELVEIIKIRDGENSNIFAKCLINSGVIHAEMNKTSKANKLCLQARNIYRKNTKEDTPEYRTCINTLKMIRLGPKDHLDYSSSIAWIPGECDPVKMSMDSMGSFEQLPNSKKIDMAYMKKLKENLSNSDATEKENLSNSNIEKREFGTRAFFSHSSKDFDKQIVDKIIRDLKNAGVQIWLDKLEIKVGDSILDKLEHGIKNNDFFIIVLSPNSVDSRWVKMELKAALMEKLEGRNITIIPAIIEPCVVPLFLKELKRVNFSKNYEKALLDLLKDLSEIPRKIYYEEYSSSSASLDLIKMNDQAADLIAKSYAVSNNHKKLDILNEAEDILSNILTQDSNFYHALENRGTVSYEKGILFHDDLLLDDALADFRSALNHAPLSSSVETIYHSLGKTYMNLYEFENLIEEKLSCLDHAIQHLDDATKKNWNFFYAHFSRGEAFSKRYEISNKKDDFLEAEKSFTRIIGLNPHFQLAKSRLHQLQEGKKPIDKYTSIELDHSRLDNTISKNHDQTHKCHEHEVYYRGKRVLTSKGRMWKKEYVCKICQKFLRSSEEFE